MAAATLLVFFLMSPFIGKAVPMHTPSASAASLNMTYLPQLSYKSSVPTTLLKKIYLPLTMQKYPLQTIFGAAMEQITSGGGLDQMVAANMYWTRLPGVIWSSVEPTEGTYDWSAMSELESELRNASSKSLQVVLIVRSTPEWARKIAGTGPTCGPIAADKLTAFGDFMQALVARYSVAPFNIKYWEMWNEPDVDPSLVPVGMPFGCWGDQSDPYFGGGYYAEMLKVVYPQIKIADPQAQVLIGGLLMDCDPRGGCAAMGKSNLTAMYLEGILQNGGASYFDGVSFHAYDYYLEDLREYYNPNWMSAWNTTGPVGIAKAQYIRSLFNKFSVSDKFLINTESALLCGKTGTEPVCLTDDFSKTKAYYVAQSYAAAIAQGLRANIWYSVLGWRASGLIGHNLSPLPAYTAFEFSRSELSNAGYVGEITAADIGGASGVMGYKFQRSDRHIWLLWSLDGSPHTINLSSAPEAAWDVLGDPVTPAGTMNISLKPSYLEWTP